MVAFAKEFSFVHATPDSLIQAERSHGIFSGLAESQGLKSRMVTGRIDRFPYDSCLSPSLAHGGEQFEKIGEFDGKTAYVGGAGDKNGHKAILKLSEKDPDGTYFTLFQKGKIKAWVAEQRELGHNVRIIGHSYGGDTAAHVVASGVKVDALITIDPVGRTRPNFNKVLENSGNWTNFNAIGGGRLNWNNIVAGVGGAWNSDPGRIPGVYHYNVNSDHMGILNEVF